MARTRRRADVEAREARSAAGGAVFATASAVAVWIAVTRYLPAEWERPTAEERDLIILIACGAFLVGCAWQLSAAALHTIRWIRARRWERLLNDPASAHLVPPLREHVRAVGRSSELKLRLTSAGAALAAVAIVINAVRSEMGASAVGEEGQPTEISWFSLLLAWAAVTAWRAANRRRLARRIEAISKSGTATADAEDAPRERAVSSKTPTVNVHFQVRREPARARPSSARTVAGDGPLHVLYLRLFDNEAGTARFLAGSWRRHAYVHLLRSADQVTPEEVEQAKDSGSVESLFISTPAELDRALARQATGRYDPPAPDGLVARWRWVHDRERGRYPVRALLCHGSFWREALDLLLPRMDHVVLDLTGYRPERTGTRYELQRLIDTYPIEKVSIIGGDGCDREFLTAQIRWAWRQMAAGSPNEGSGSRTISVWLPTVTARAA